MAFRTSSSSFVVAALSKYTFIFLFFPLLGVGLGRYPPEHIVFLLMFRRVGLFAASPRSLQWQAPVGFPLQSLTQIQDHSIFNCFTNFNVLSISVCIYF